MSLKEISYLELWQSLGSVEQNHLCNFGRRHHEEQFFEIILNLDQCFRRCRLKIFLNWSSGSQFVQQNGTICAILVEGIMRNNSVNLFRIWASGSGEDVVLKSSYLELWPPFCSVEQNHLCNFERGHHGEHSCELVKLYEIWTSGSGVDVVKKKVYRRRMKTDHNTSP